MLQEIPLGEFFMGTVTCGTIFYKEGKILLCHATDQKHWDLPKGKVENGETYAEAAVRECKEEIGFQISVNDLHFLGKVSYVRGKQLALFYSTSRKPEIDELKCESTFINHRGFERLECDAFKYVPVTELDKYCTKRMCKSIRNAIETFLDNKKENKNES